MQQFNGENMVIALTTIVMLALCLTNGQVTLPSMVTIPPDAPLASSNGTNFSMYVMTVYDEACVNQSNSSGNNTNSTTNDDDSTLSQWTQSQYVVYIGAVALNNNNTCQVVCQVQTLKQFAIMFGSDIRTRSVMVGRVYMTSMQDDTACTLSGSQGVCMGGECIASDDTNSTSTMMPETSTMSDTTTMLPDNSTTTDSMNSTTTDSTNSTTSATNTTASG